MDNNITNLEREQNFAEHFNLLRRKRKYFKDKQRFADLSIKSKWKQIKYFWRGEARDLGIISKAFSGRSSKDSGSRQNIGHQIKKSLLMHDGANMKLAEAKAKKKAVEASRATVRIMLRAAAQFLAGVAAGIIGILIAFGPWILLIIIIAASLALIMNQINI